MAAQICTRTQGKGGIVERSNRAIPSSSRNVGVCASCQACESRIASQHQNDHPSRHTYLENAVRVLILTSRCLEARRRLALCLLLNATSATWHTTVSVRPTSGCVTNQIPTQRALKPSLFVAEKIPFIYQPDLLITSHTSSELACSPQYRIPYLQSRMGIRSQRLGRTPGAGDRGPERASTHAQGRGGKLDVLVLCAAKQRGRPRCSCGR